MKLIVAIIRPARLPCVQLALKRFSIDSLTTTETLEHGSDDGHTLIYRSAQIRVRSTPKLRLELIVNDDDAEDIVDAIVDANIPLRRGLQSDCKVFAVPLEQYFGLSSRQYQEMYEHAQ